MCHANLDDARVKLAWFLLHLCHCRSNRELREYCSEIIVLHSRQIVIKVERLRLKELRTYLVFWQDIRHVNETFSLWVFAVNTNNTVVAHNLFHLHRSIHKHDNNTYTDLEMTDTYRALWRLTCSGFQMSVLLKLHSRSAPHKSFNSTFSSLTL